MSKYYICVRNKEEGELSKDVYATTHQENWFAADDEFGSLKSLAEQSGWACGSVEYVGKEWDNPANTVGVSIEEAMKIISESNKDKP